MFSSLRVLDCQGDLRGQRSFFLQKLLLVTKKLDIGILNVSRNKNVRILIFVLESNFDLRGRGLFTKKLWYASPESETKRFSGTINLVGAHRLISFFGIVMINPESLICLKNGLLTLLIPTIFFTK